MNILEKHKETPLIQSLLSARSGLDLTNRFLELWKAFEGLEDPHFFEEIKNDPESRLWEMIFASILSYEGFTIRSAPKGPDFEICTIKREMYVEAIAPTPGQEGHKDAVPELDLESTEAREIPTEKIVLRIRSAFEDKARKIARYLNEGIISPKWPAIIAINTMKIIGSAGSYPPIGLQAFLGYGRPYAVFDRVNMNFKEDGIEFRSEIVKSNKSLVGTIPFMKDDYSHISGVIVSDANFFSYQFDALKDSYFLPNPFANNQMQSSDFREISQFWTFASSDKSQWRTFKV